MRQSLFFEERVAGYLNYTNREEEGDNLNYRFIQTLTENLQKGMKTSSAECAAGLINKYYKN